MNAVQHSFDSNFQHKSVHSAQSTATQDYQTGVTEVVLPAQPDQEYAFVLPMLAHLSRQTADRWFTWIAPRGIHRAKLLEFGFVLSKLRIIYTESDEQTRRVLREALALGNSATVVASYENLNEEDLRKLEAAAQQGKCQALLLRHRQQSW